MADASGALVSIDESWTERTGGPVADALGRGFLEYIHPEDRQGLGDAWTAATRDSEEYLFDHRVRMADGAYRWFRCRAEKFRSRDGGEVFWRGLLSDVDELIRARAAAEANAARFSKAAWATRDVIWEIDIATDTLTFSNDLDSTLGYGNVEAVGALAWCRERIHPDDLARFTHSFFSCPEGERWICEYRTRRADGAYAHVQARAFIERDRNGRAIRATGALSDLTEERATQQRIEQLQSEMLDISRSGTAAALAGMLSHELNQPLTSLTNYVRGARRLLLQDDPLSRDRILLAVESAATNALDAGAIVHRMRELTLRGEGRLSVHNLWEAANDACALTSQNSAGGGVRIMIASALSEFDIIADRIQTRQVFVNLLRNAVDALDDTPTPAISVAATASGDFVKVEIADNGRGFGVNQPEGLFAPFMTTKLHGVGLGLAICQMIIESNGGQIWAENAATGGAAFCFTLPLAEKKP
ncbi:PAS domain-containing protein [Sphingomonas qilianensis]|uniref:histidine kinase n=1 Tax=Sphingomonas qilianensis TaxID=1736690 RepID=A0ABU9XMJ5_9SPHN